MANMNDWKQGFYQAIKDYVGLPADAEITDISESRYEYGGCETCGPDYSYITEITYSTSTRGYNYTSVDIRLGEFINSL